MKHGDGAGEHLEDTENNKNIFGEYKEGGRAMIAFTLKKKFFQVCCEQQTATF